MTDKELVALGYPESSLTLAHEAVAVLLAEGSDDEDDVLWVQFVGQRDE